MTRRMLVGLFALALLSPLRMGVAAPRPVVHAGILHGHPAVVVVGYTAPAGSTGRVDFVAYRVRDGVRVVAFTDPTPPQGAGNDPGTLGDTTIEDVTIPGATIELIPNPGGPGPNVRIDATLPVTGEIHLQSYDPFFLGGYGDDIIPGLYSHLHDYREPSHPTFEGTIGVGGASGSIGGTPVEWAGLKWSTDNANLEWVYTG